MKRALSIFPYFKIPKKQPIAETQKVTQGVAILEPRQLQKVNQLIKKKSKIDFSTSQKQNLLGDEREESDQIKTIEPKQIKLSSFFSKPN